jgi:hypothetical protein
VLPRYGRHPGGMAIAAWHIFFFYSNRLVNWTDALVGDKALG